LAPIPRVLAFAVILCVSNFFPEIIAAGLFAAIFQQIAPIIARVWHKNSGDFFQDSCSNFFLEMVPAF